MDTYTQHRYDPLAQIKKNLNGPGSVHWCIELKHEKGFPKAESAHYH